MSAGLVKVKNDNPVAMASVASSSSAGDESFTKAQNLGDHF